MFENTDKIWVTVTSKVNVGNFESIQVEAGMTRSLDEVEKQNAFEVISQVSEQLTSQIVQKTEQIRDDLDYYKGEVQEPKKNKHKKKK